MGKRGENWKVGPYNILFISHTPFPSADTSLSSFPCFSVAEDSLKAELISLQIVNYLYKPHALTDLTDGKVWQTKLVLWVTILQFHPTAVAAALTCCVQAESFTPLIQTQSKHRGFSPKLYLCCISLIFEVYKISSCLFPCHPMPAWVRNRP